MHVSLPKASEDSEDQSLPSGGKKSGVKVLRMEEIRSRHFETMVETIVRCYLQGNRIIPNLLKWCGNSSIHGMGVAGPMILP